MMKRFFLALSLVAVLGFGCPEKKGELTVTNESATENEAGSNVYSNSQYGFELTLPSTVEAKPRPEEEQATDYLGLPVQFFVSIRDLVRDEKTVLNLAYVYAVPDLTVDGLVEALEKSSAKVKVSARDVMDVNGVEVTKVVSSTEAGDDKTHYVFQGKDVTIVISVFLYQDEYFAPILASLKKI